MAKALPKPFKYRGGWRAQVTCENGTRPVADFGVYEEAKQWIVDTLANANSAHEPELGGPTQATLAQALNHYATLYTVAKGGVGAELNRINHYLAPQDLPLLRAAKNEDGQISLETYQPKPQPEGWQDHNDKRRALRAKTYDAIAKLAAKRCSVINTADIRRLMATMTSDGLSDSTQQKEIALLRHLFNVAAKEWNWKGFENPTEGIKLGKSQMRFVFLTKEQQESLWKAISECDNPYFWPLVRCCLETTMRKSSLRAMRWDRTDLDGRVAQVPTKTGMKTLALSMPIVDVLKQMVHSPCGKVFPMSDYAIDMAWDGVRMKAGLKHLQFRDLRHLGATEYARRGFNAQQLKKVLGHETEHMANVYVNLVNQDVLDIMDATAREVPVIQVPPPMSRSAADVMKERRATRIVNALKDRARELQEVAASSVVDSQESPQFAANSAQCQRQHDAEAASICPSSNSRPGVPACRATEPAQAETDMAIDSDGSTMPSARDARSVSDNVAAASNVFAFKPRHRTG